MGQPVVFDYTKWVATFPEFTAVEEPQATLYFGIAELYFANCGWTASLRNAPLFLNLLTAHVAWLLSPRDAAGHPSSAGTQPAPQVVGRISSASEGSVSVSVELQPSGSPSEAFFTQTKYGFLFWQGTAQFRTARYVPAPRLGVVNGAFPAIGYGGRFR